VQSRSEWGTEGEAEERDRLIAAMDAALQPLGIRPDLDEDHYRQHDVALVNEARAQVLEAFARVNRDPRIRECTSMARAGELEPMAGIGRWIDDAGPAPINRAWGRLMCIDKRGREWEQPYFVNHPPHNAKCIA
jgi:hypothetical protein